MTDELHDLLTRRAERARPAQSPERVAALVAARAERLAHARRTRLAVASGTAVVVAAAGVGIAIADTGTSGGSTDPHHVGRTAAGAPVSDGHTATELPHYRPLHGTATGHGVRVREKEAALAAQLERQARRAAQRAARLRREQLGGPAVPGSATLVPSAPAPSAAEISLGLVPKGFGYLSLNDAETFYGPPGTTAADYFADGIVVDVHRTAGDTSAYTLRVGGKPARYDESDDGVSVRVRYSRTIDIGFQAPASAQLSEHQALRMAAGLDVRSTAHTTKG
ncbi:hypothetical protein [Jatrophihabitans endophyticus]|uniref:hypothetical protein n=1 Tax=Jatrophihabitans endophyticus TaxID=1206085 RepID=UPI0019FA418A|nr:hypothetical protein [Jatrophihabitans endophyticus]MBE7188210.1 hypothetical protein [Jatrophihabitans endophyticus]